MKKHIFLTVIILGIMTVSSLKAQFSIGPGIHYGTQIEQIGISANANYDFTDKFGVLGGYTYFLPKNSLNWWALDFDGTYSFVNLNDKSKLYALAGLNLLYYKYPGISSGYSTTSVSTTSTGVNIGAGWKLGLGKKMDLVPEVRYTFGNADYLRFGVKLMFGL